MSKTMFYITFICACVLVLPVIGGEHPKLADKESVYSASQAALLVGTIDTAQSELDVIARRIRELRGRLTAAAQQPILVGPAAVEAWRVAASETAAYLRAETTINELGGVVGWRCDSDGTTYNIATCTGGGWRDKWDSLGVLRDLRNLRVLILEDDELPNKGVARLSQLRRLRVLRLRSKRITDEALEELSGIPTLKVLVLDCPRVTLAGLRHLETLDLEELELYGIAATAENVNRWRRENMPSTEVTVYK